MSNIFRATTDYYYRALQQLVPQGVAWPREDGATLSKLLRGLAVEITRMHNRLIDLIDEFHPLTTTELLTEWETEFGLPSDCTQGLDLVLQERRRLVHNRKTSRGGQSIPFFIDVAAQLGFEVTITEFYPFLADHSAAEDAVYSDPWMYAWRVNAPETTIVDFVADHSSAEDPLRKWGNELLECEIAWRKPGQTRVLFAYG
ncbi:MAG: putative phage tail protein [Rhodospirillales bacterium]